MANFLTYFLAFVSAVNLLVPADKISAVHHHLRYPFYLRSVGPSAPNQGSGEFIQYMEQFEHSATPVLFMGM